MSKYKSKFSIGSFFPSHLKEFVYDVLWAEDYDELTSDWWGIEDGTRVVVFDDDPCSCITLDNWIKFWSDFPEWYLPVYVLSVNDMALKVEQMTPEQAYDEWMGIDDDIYTIASHRHAVAFGVKDGDWQCC